MDFSDWSGLLVPALPIVAILMPIFIVFIALYFRHQRFVAINETVRHLADKGMPVPKDLLDPEPARTKSPLLTAMTLIGTGIGLIIFFKAMGMGGLWGIGALVAIIGAAQLVGVAIEAVFGRPKARAPATPPEP